MEAYVDCDATELAARVQKGELSPLELVEQAIAAIEKVNPALNAVVHRLYDDARERCRRELPQGPFRGVPMVVKDFDGFVAGAPFTASCRFLDGWVPDHDSEAIARLRRAGFVFVAKTNCPELAIMGTTEPAWRGPTRNPWNTAHSSGGSSGGSGALVAARAVPLGHGGDGGGSLRIPGSHCGLIGFKATRGRVPLGPDQGEGWGGYVQWGGLTRSVRDAAALLDVMAGPMPGDPYAAAPLPGPLADEVGRDPGKLRIAFHRGALFGRGIHPDNAAGVDKVAAELASLGHHVEEACPDFDRVELATAYLTQVAVGIAAEIADMERWRGREARPQDFEPATFFLKQIGSAVSALELQQARDAVQVAGRACAAFHERFDVFLCATTAYPPVRIGELALGAAQKAGLGLLRALPAKAVLRKALSVFAAESLDKTPNTQLFNQTGQPAISLPLHQSRDGLPLGMQLVAPMGREDLLVRLSAQLETALPWAARRPAVVAGAR
ncbi:MAG: amidase [Myxococcales bacterium]|nr:amidase [Myxococcales bacterium]